MGTRPKGQSFRGVFTSGDPVLLRWAALPKSPTLHTLVSGLYSDTGQAAEWNHGSHAGTESVSGMHFLKHCIDCLRDTTGPLYFIQNNKTALDRGTCMAHLKEIARPEELWRCRLAQLQRMHGREPLNLPLSSRYDRCNTRLRFSSRDTATRPSKCGDLEF